jgi:hypothetical protein
MLINYSIQELLCINIYLHKLYFRNRGGVLPGGFRKLWQLEIPILRADAQHIAIATVARVDALVSWNFKHIVNLNRIHGYNSVNLRRGYPMIEIRAPREVLPDEKDPKEV